MLSAAGHPIMLPGGIGLPPIVPRNLALFAWLRSARHWLSLLLFAIILLHMAAALFHGLVRRDGVMSSMASLRRREGDRRVRAVEEPAVSCTLKRAYEKPSSDHGTRVLVDRLWPRGVRKEKARIDVWLKEVAPSTQLRKWFGHDPEKWPEFQKRYRAELKGSAALAELRKLARQGHVTLVYGAKDKDHNDAVVLAKLLRR